MDKKVLSEAGLSMMTCRESYLHAIEDSIRFSNPTFTDDQIDKAMIVVSNLIRQASDSIR
jgi:hypothetical protein